MKIMKILAAILAIGLFSVNFFAQTGERNKKQILQELLVFKDQNLFREESYETSKKASALLDELAFRKEQESKNGFRFWRVRYIWESAKNQSNPKYAVMESTALIILPGQQAHRVYFFDKDANLLNREDFTTGWRMIVGTVELINREDKEFPIIKISAAGGGGFAYAQSMIQYYALLENSIVLIRLESKGITVLDLDDRNSYGCQYSSIGPKMPARSIEEWTKSLNSKNKAEILRTLMWLAGKHESLDKLNQSQRDQDEQRKNNPDLEVQKTTLEKCPGIVDEIRLYEAVKNHPDVRKRVRELTGSTDQWIGEAARLAEKPIEKRKRNQK